MRDHLSPNILPLVSQPAVCDIRQLYQQIEYCQEAIFIGIMESGLHSERIVQKLIHNDRRMKRKGLPVVSWHKNQRS